MTDDNAHPQRPDESVEPLPEQAPTSPDDTPADAADESGEAAFGPGAIEDDHSMWMRPPAGQEAPRVREPELDVTPDQDDAPQEPGLVTDIVHDGESPVEELKPVHADAATVGANAALASAEKPGAPLDQQASREQEPEAAVGGRGWRGLLPWIAAALALGLAAFGFFYNETKRGVTVVTESPTPTATPTPVITEADLMTVKDANLVAKQSWTAGKTLEKIATTSPHVACVVSSPGQPNPILTRQRTLTTTAKDALGALHQVDAYASTGDAQRVFQMRAGNIATCSDIPALIVGSDTIRGIGDEAASMTIAFQEKAATTFHTVVIARTGTTVHMVDVARNGNPVSAADTLKGLVGPVDRQCGRAKGKCSTKPEATAALPPAVTNPGWLLAADLPRVVPGEGMWQATDTKAVDTVGSNCEQMNLVSVAGPDQREQRTYLMTLDSAAPQNFGVDQVVFTFAKPADAKAFSDKLSTNIAECSKKVLTAKISESAKVQGKVSDGGTFEGKTFLVTQSMGGNQATLFRVGVSQVGNKVLYLLNNPTKAYDPTSKTFGQVVVRASERASQAR